MGGSLDNDLPTADLLSSTTNEAAHRLQVIDRLLIDCLGWPPERIECEEHQAGEYLGYLPGRPGASTSSATAAGSAAGPVPNYVRDRAWSQHRDDVQVLRDLRAAIGEYLEEFSAGATSKVSVDAVRR